MALVTPGSNKEPVHPLADGGPTTPVNQAQSELGTSIRFGLPPAVPGRLAPPLRVGDSYRLGMRRVYVNGGSLSLDQAIAYAYNVAGGAKSTLGGEDGSDYKFLRREEIAPPLMHFAEDDPLIKADARKRLPGDQHDLLVVRGVARGNRVRRYLTPPRASFDLCEYLGVFDCNNENMPSGAFSYLNLNSESGAFPVAIDGHIQHPSGDPVNALGTVLQFARGRQQQSANPFYPDPFAGSCCLALSDEDGALTGIQPISFYSASWPNAQPLLIELLGTDDQKQTAAINLPSTPHHPPQYPTLSITKASITLPRGSRAQLRMWAVPKNLQDLQNFDVIDRMGIAVKNVVTPPIPLANDMVTVAQSAFATVSGMIAQSDAAQNYADWMSRAPVANVSAHRDITVVYPVEKPVVAPSFTEYGPIHHTPHINLVRIVNKKDPPKPGELDGAWSKYVAEQSNVDMIWDSQAGGSIAYFTGLIDFHRHSTEKVRCAGFWSDFSDSAAFIRNGDGYDYRPQPKHDVMFTIDNISYGQGYSSSNTTGQLDLLHDERGVLRASNYSFNDSIARRITLRLYAASRYQSYFPKTTQATQFETVDQAKDAVVWLKNTATPDVVAVDRIVPLFNWQPLPHDQDRLGWAVKRSCKLRIYLKRPWFTTGEGEQLAIVLSKESAISLALSNDPTISAWGADPIRQTGKLDPIQASAFQTASTMDVKVPVPVSDQNPSPDAVVERDVIICTPNFDHDEGLHYCDIAFADQSHGVAWPFVKLALSRYQSQSIVGKEISTPVAEWAQLPPTREVHLTVDEHNGRNFRLSITGPAQRSMSPGHYLHPRRHKRTAGCRR